MNSDNTFDKMTAGARVAWCLRSWEKLNLRLKELTEAEVECAFQIESANKRRKNVLHRLRQRLGSMRAKRLHAQPL